MTKLELATEIAVGLFPKEFWIDSPAVQGEVTRLMKFKKPNLQAIYDFGKGTI